LQKPILDSYMVVIRCRRIVRGLARGEALISDKPINFLTMIDARNGLINDLNHVLHGKSLKDKILVFPHSVGSSVGAYVLYSLKKKSLPHLLLSVLIEWT
jgi:uncharacterized protein